MTPNFITSFLCPPCGESTAKGGVRGLLSKETSFYNPPTALQATSPTRGADKRGFTLIELLVVVLIIGILVAVALPQYQVAVAKSKAATLLPVLKIISDAQQIYRDANGTYASRFDLLDVDLPAGGTLNESGSIMSYPNGKKFDIWTGETNFSIRGFIDNEQTFLLEYYMDGRHYCYAQKTNELANKICKSFSGQGGQSSGSYNAYIM